VRLAGDFVLVGGFRKDLTMDTNYRSECIRKLYFSLFCFISLAGGGLFSVNSSYAEITSRLITRSGCIAKSLSQSAQELEAANAYHTGSGRAEYTADFGPLYTDAETRLRAEDTVIDFGAGSAKADIELLDDAIQKNRPTPHALAIALDRPETGADLKLMENRVKSVADFQFIKKDVERLSRDQLPEAALEIDHNGPLSYTRKFSEVLQLYIDVLKPVEGSLFCHINSNNITIKIGENPVSLTDWLKSIPGLEVTVVKTSVKHISGRPPQYITLGYKIRKLKKKVKIPELGLESSTQNPEGPLPIRVFKQVKPPSFWKSIFQ
jgi:hypothetical protein